MWYVLNGNCYLQCKSEHRRNSVIIYIGRRSVYDILQLEDDATSDAHPDCETTTESD